MEEFSRKLNSKNQVIQIQALSKLLSIGLKKLPQIGAPDGTPNIPEVQFLWEKCNDENAVVSHGICQVLVTLVAQNRLNFDYVTNGFVSQVLSSRCTIPACLIRAIKDLIVLYTLSNKEENHKPIFKLGSSIHPFILILQHRPELWTDILDQIKIILCHHSKSNRTNVYQAISPVLKAILWNPARSNDLAMLRLKLTMHLSDAKGNQNVDVDDLLLFMDKSLQWIQVDSVSNVLESTAILEEMSKLYFAHPSHCINCRLDNLMLCLTLVCLERVKYSIDITSCIECLMLIAKHTEQMPMTKCSLASLVSLSSLLNLCLLVHQNTIVDICLVLTERQGFDALVSSCLVLPLVTILNVSSHWNPLAGIISISPKPAALKLLSRIEEALTIQGQPQDSGIENCPVSPNTEQTLIVDLTSFCETSFCATRIVHLAQHFLNNRLAVGEWLYHVSHHIRITATTVSCQLLNFVAAIASHGLQDQQIVEETINVLVLVAEKDLEKAPSLVSILLYKLQRERDPGIRLHILKSLPRIAVHKICTPSILGTIQAFSQKPELQSLCLRLMGLLWQNQERAFPHLQKVLLVSETDSRSVAVYSVDDALLSRAACIRDICQIKPHLYGAEFLSWLSQLIINNRNTNGTPVTVLALESISLLCKAQVIDLQTTWKFLFQKLQRDKRPLVVQQMCQLLSLAESLKSSNQEYEKFLLESVSLLWFYAQTWNDHNVNGAAFKGLSNFDCSRHTLKHFCQEVKGKVKLPSHLAATPFDMAKKPEDVLTYVPGSCYIDLMQLTHKQAVQDFGILLCSLVKQEIRDMPQSLLYYVNVRSSMSGINSSDGCIDRIPIILNEKYEMGNLPGLQGSMALGLLLAFDFPLVLGNDKIPTKQSIVKQGKMYEDMLDVLLVQACLEVSDWRKSIVFSTAWCAFMERLYFSMVQARMIQIDLLQNRPTNEEFSANQKNLKNSAWLFIRDKICDTLQNASRGKASVHGNTLLAICGLAAAILKYCNSNVLELKEEMTEYMPHRYWMSGVVKAITCVIEVRSDVPSGRFAWCQPGPGASCSIAQAYAFLSVEMLTPILINMGLGSVNELLMIYFEQIRKSTNVPLLQFCLGIGLGQFGCRLVNEHFFNVGGDEGKQILLRIANKLKEWCFIEEELDSKCGGLLGLAICTSAFSSITNDEFQEFVLTVHQNFEERLENEPVSTLPHDILSVGLSLVSISGCSSVLPKEKIENYAEDLQRKCFQYPNSSGTATAYGLVLHYLEANGGVKYITLRNSQMSLWMETLKKENAPTLAKLAAANGSFSSTPLCFEIASWHVRASAKQSCIDGSVKKFVNNLTIWLDSSRDINILNCCTWMLGVAHWSAKRSNEAADGASLDYSYLPASSILRPVVAFIQDFAEKGRRSELEPYVLICLRCLSQESHKPFPNLSWSSLLSPIFSISAEIQELCIDVVLARLSSSAAAVPLLSSWILGSTEQLHRSSKMKLFTGMPKFMNYVTSRTLELFLRKNLDVVFDEAGKSTQMSKPFLEGIVSAMLAPSPAIGVTQILNLVVAEIFHCIDANCTEAWDTFCVATEQLNDDVLDQMIVPKPADYKHMVKVVMLSCYLVGSGKQPIQLLNECFDTALACNLNAENYHTIVTSMMRCFCAPANRKIDINSRLNWLLQLMGHIKNIMHWQSNLKISGINHMKEVIAHFFDVFACSVIGWSSTQLHIFYWKLNTEKQDVLKFLPSSLQHLMTEAVWNQHNKKVAYWLLDRPPNSRNLPFGHT